MFWKKNVVKFIGLDGSKKVCKKFKKDYKLKNNA